MTDGAPDTNTPKTTLPDEHEHAAAAGPGPALDPDVCPKPTTVARKAAPEGTTKFGHTWNDWKDGRYACSGCGAPCPAEPVED